MQVCMHTEEVFTHCRLCFGLLWKVLELTSQMRLSDEEFLDLFFFGDFQC